MLVGARRARYRHAPAAAEDLTALLARPVSPGAIALLAEHATQPAAQKRLIEAVRHEDPAVRAVAARVAFVTMSKGVASALISTVAKEEHVHTGAEQVRALMALLGAPGDSIVLGAVKRLGAPAAIAMAESLARTRPEDIPRHLPVLVAATAKSDMPELGAALATASVQHPTQAKDIVEAVLAAKSDDLWKAVLDPLHITGRRVTPAALLAGLTAAEESQRVRMLWHVFTLSGEGAPLPEDVMAAAAPRPDRRERRRRGPHLGSVRARAVRAAARHGRDQGGLGGPAGAPRAQGARQRTCPFFAYGWLTDAEVDAIDTVTGRRGEAGKVRSAARREREKAEARQAADAVHADDSGVREGAAGRSDGRQRLPSAEEFGVRDPGHADAVRGRRDEIQAGRQASRASRSCRRRCRRNVWRSCAPR